MNNKTLDLDQIITGRLPCCSYTLKLYRLQPLPTLIAVLTFLLISGFTQLFPANASEQKNSSNSPQKMVLLDFESDKQLDELGWKCGTYYERTKEYATSGQYSLKMEMYPQVIWPGFSKIIKTSWAGYDKISFNIFNPAPDPIQISYRIDDRRNNPPYNDRANGRLRLNPGANTITLDLGELKTSDGKRQLDLSKICSFLLFLHQPQKKVTLYLDDLILTKTRPVERVTDQNHAPGTKRN